VPARDERRGLEDTARSPVASRQEIPTWVNETSDVYSLDSLTALVTKIGLSVRIRAPILMSSIVNMPLPAVAELVNS
jgi:hypothetical protein